MRNCGLQKRQKNSDRKNQDEGAGIMNTYTRSLKDGAETVVTSRQHQPVKKPWFFAFAIKIILMCAFIFGAVTCRVMYNAKIEALNKEATKIQMRIRKINLITANLRNKREELTAYPYISAKIKQYKLGLREADYRQISYLRIIDLPEKRARKQHIVSSERKYRERNSAVASAH